MHLHSARTTHEDSGAEAPPSEQVAAPSNGHAPGEGSPPIAQRLASSHRQDGKACRRTPLYADFPAIADLLAETHRQFLKTAETTLAVPYAAEWILDNYYVIQQALRQIKQDLPPKYYAELPKLGDTVALCGYPRVYALALAILAAESLLPLHPQLGPVRWETDPHPPKCAGSGMSWPHDEWQPSGWWSLVVEL